MISRILMVFKIKADAAIDRAEDPRELVDYAYSQLTPYRAMGDLRLTRTPSSALHTAIYPLLPR